MNLKTQLLTVVLILPMLACGFEPIVNEITEPIEAEAIAENNDPIIIEVPNEVAEVPEEEQPIVEIEEFSQVAFTIPSYPGMKKWMSYRAFGSGTKQKLLQQFAVTNEKGFRMIGNRYLVALGTHFGAQIGQCFDLVLVNGTVIPCVLGDVKAPQHTDASNIFSNTTKNLCASEFIVDTKLLDSAAKHRGDASFAYTEEKDAASKDSK